MKVFFISLSFFCCFLGFAGPKNFEELDSTKIALVHVSSNPIPEVMIPGQSISSPNFSMAEIDKLTPQTRLTLHFCMNNMVPELPREGEGGPKWEESAKYAVIVPLSKKLLERCPCYTLADVSLWGPLNLKEHNAVFIAPEGERTQEGAIFYNPHNQNIRQTVVDALNQKGFYIFQHTHTVEKREIEIESVSREVSPYREEALFGKDILIPETLFSCFGLEKKQPTLHSRSIPYFLEDYLNFILEDLYPDRIMMQEVFLEGVYLPRFLERCIVDECLEKENYSQDAYDVEEVLEKAKEVLTILDVPLETAVLFEKRCAHIKVLKRIWEEEKKSVLQRGKSFFFKRGFFKCVVEVV